MVRKWPLPAWPGAGTHGGVGRPEERRAWVVKEMMERDPRLTREEAERVYDETAAKNLVQRR